MKKSIRFILIDDDIISNFLSTVFIEEAAGISDIQPFDNPENAFEYIYDEYSKHEISTVLFLDINMPTSSGWDFLNKFEKLNEKIKAFFKIYMLSSSVNPADEQRATENKNVAGYIFKPLSVEIVMSILEEYNI